MDAGLAWSAVGLIRLTHDFVLGSLLRAHSSPSLPVISVVFRGYAHLAPCVAPTHSQAAVWAQTDGA
eukprot:350318-Chlamydomonas_euryale.AAC.6